MAIAAAGAVAAGAAEAQDIANPYSFRCADYLAAQQGEGRSEANAVLYWAAGYLQGRLEPLPTTNFSAESFGRDIGDVHAALLRICPNVPEMQIATFMANLAGDFEKSAVPQR